MKPIKTHESNFTYLGPTENISDLPVQRAAGYDDDNKPFVIVYSVWELTEEERWMVSEGSNIKLGILNLEPIPPVIMELTAEVEAEEEEDG